MQKFIKMLRFIFSRKAAVIVMLLLQIILFVFSFFMLQDKFAYVFGLSSGLSILIVFYVMNKQDNPSYKLAWIIPILLVPIFGGIIYLFLNTQLDTVLFKKNLKDSIDKSRPFYKQDEEILERIRREEAPLDKLVHYMNGDGGGFPIYDNTAVEYYPLGEDKFESLKRELKSARKFIFMEYFIIERGKMWDEILEILKDRVNHGVDVRILYDGMGSLMVLPDKYNKKLNEMGIHCKVFNQFRPFLSSSQNNRDHRKIAIIDGKAAFTGGVNLADEYINEIEKHGHWKDTAVMLKGEAVWSFTVMFLQMWHADGTDPEENFEQFKYDFQGNSERSAGYVLPYGDSPLDDEPVGEAVYMEVIDRAQDYIYICTPYLVLDYEMTSALKFAAKSGVDVRIILPGIPDKWYAFAAAQCYCKTLLEAGVKIYRYKPGFIHAKSFVSDDKVGVVGTINLDYRSLYLHFECAALMYRHPVIKDIKDDYLSTLEKCVPMTLEELRDLPLYKKIINSVLGLFAPLM